MTVEASQPAKSNAPPGRVRRAVITWAMGAIYSGITILLGFITTPILLGLLTAERIGAARAVGEWIGYLMLADLGMGAAVGVLLVRARTTGLESAAGVAKLALRVLCGVSLFVVPAALVLAWFMPTLIRIEPNLTRELRIGAAIAALALLLAPLSVFRAVLETGQRGYLVNAALLLQSLLITGLSLLLAWLGWGLIGLSIAGLAGGIVFAAMTTLWAIRHLGVFASAPRADLPLREVWRVSWPLAAAGAGNRINLMTDGIVVGYLLGSTPVAVMFLTQRVILLCSAQVNSMSNASWAALAELINSGRKDIFQLRVAELARLIVGLGIVLVGTVAAYDAQFVRLWVGGSMYGGDALAALTVASTVVFGFLCLFSWIIDMQGDTRHRLPVSTAGSILNLLLSVIFVRKLGLAGVALGTLCAYLLTDAWYSPMLVCRRYGVPARLILFAAARGLLVGLPWALAAWFLARSHTPPLRWIGFSAECAVVGIVALAYCWWIVLTTNDRQEWRQRLRRLRPNAA